jgi:hypothetical protein
MENDSKRTIAFSLMATLNNTSRNLFSCVYMPIFKYGLAQYSKYSNAGQDRDLQESIRSNIGIQIPLLTIRKMLSTLNDEISRKEKQKIGLNILDRGKSFQIISYEYQEIDELIDGERRKINALNMAFIAYCPDCGPSDTFDEFIRFNCNKLSGFFSSKKVIDLAEDELLKYKKQAEFLKYIEQYNSELYEIAKNAYIGSFISVLLETGFDLSARSIDNVAYYIDTKIVLSALNLQTEIEYQSSQELLDLIRKSKGSVCIMDQTIEEIEFNLRNAIDYFNSNPALEIIHNKTINAAAIRRGLTKTDLQLFLKEIRNIVIEKLKATVLNVPNTIIEKARNSEDLPILERIRERKPATALHDIIAIQYIRELRGGSISNHKKVKAWFVTDNDGLYNFNIKIIHANTTPEVVLTEDLAFLLWLKDIDKGNAPFLKIGLNEYISRVMVSDLPDYKILDDLYNNLRKYKETDPEAAHEVLDSLANASLAEIKKLNILASKEPDEFSKQIEILKNERQRQISTIKSEKEEMDRKNKDHQEKISKLITSNEKLQESIGKIESEILPTIQKTNQLLTTKNENITEQNRRYRKILIAILIISLFGFMIYLGITYLTGFFRCFITVIASLGGLWSFINLVFNVGKSIFAAK